MCLPRLHRSSHEDLLPLQGHPLLIQGAPDGALKVPQENLRRSSKENLGACLLCETCSGLCLSLAAPFISRRLRQAPETAREVAREKIERSSKESERSRSSKPPVPPPPPVPLKGSVKEEEDDEDNCIICLDNDPGAQLRPCGHSAVCRNCTCELMTRSQPCPLCRKPVSGFEVGVYSNSVGKRGLWPTTYKNLRQLASGEGLNKYFQKQFNGNEVTYMRWKEVFIVLEIVGGKGTHSTVRESMEQQVPAITRSEGLVKLRALAKLCNREFFDDKSLLVVAWRRILEVLELAMPPAVEKKLR